MSECLIWRNFWAFLSLSQSHHSLDRSILHAYIMHKERSRNQTQDLEVGYVFFGYFLDLKLKVYSGFSCRLRHILLILYGLATHSICKSSKHFLKTYFGRLHHISIYSEAQLTCTKTVPLCLYDIGNRLPPNHQPQQSLSRQKKQWWPGRLDLRCPLEIRITKVSQLVVRQSQLGYMIHHETWDYSLTY